MSKTIYQLRDELADVLGIGSISAHDAPLRYMLTSFLKTAQESLFWDRYSLPSMLQYWEINTVVGVNKYGYPGGVQAPRWLANTQYNVQDVVTDNVGNTQICGATGVSGLVEPAPWNAVLGGATNDGTATWSVLAIGTFIAPQIEPRKCMGVWLIYNNAWLAMDEGIDARNYTLTSSMYPQRYAHRAGPLFEVWPSPSGAYKVMMYGYQKLASFTKDTDSTTVDDRLVFYRAAALAKANPKFKQSDAAVYQGLEQQVKRELAAAAHGNQRYIPGGGSDFRTRPMPILGNPQ